MTSAFHGIRIVAVAVCTLIAGLLGLCAGAAAQGGKSIAGAPVVAYGQQQFGNSLDGRTTPSGGCGDKEFNYDTFWALPATSGDLLTIDWESQDAGLRLWLLPIGTTDFTVDSTSNVATQYLAANGKNELVYTAPRTGAIPLQFHTRIYCNNGSPGPYDFMAYVKHAVVLSVVRTTSLPARGAIDVSVHDPDGNPISDPSLVVTLRIRVGTAVRTFGQSSPVNGIARVAYSLPRKLKRKKVSVGAAASGPNYRSKASSKFTARVR